TAYHFNQVAAVGLIANAVVVPIMGLGATVLGLGASLLSFIWLAPAAAILGVAGALVDASNRLAAGFGQLPFAWARAFTPTLLELAIAYAMLLIWLTAPIRGVAASARSPAITNRMRAVCAIVLVIGAIADSAWWVHDRFYDPKLRVTFLSVGEGDSA